MTNEEIELKVVNRNGPEQDKEGFIKIVSIWMNLKGIIKIKQLKDISNNDLKELFERLLESWEKC